MSGPARRLPRRDSPPLPSATLMLLRQSRAGIEVLLLKRVARAAFGGAWVFPGGVLDGQDGDASLRRRCPGLHDHRASRMLGLPRNGLDYWVAAIRETFEETGVLIAVNGCGQGPRGTLAERQALLEGRIRFAELCRRRNWTLPVKRLHYVSHWITPRAAPRRFSTRFFLAESSPGIRVRADGKEVLQARWFEPGQALEQEIPLAHPTRHCLRILSGMGTMRRTREWAASIARKPVPAISPEVRRIDGRLMSCLPTGEVLGRFKMKDYPVA